MYASTSVHTGTFKTFRPKNATLIQFPKYVLDRELSKPATTKKAGESRSSFLVQDVRWIEPKLAVAGRRSATSCMASAPRRTCRTCSWWSHWVRWRSPARTTFSSRAAASASPRTKLAAALPATSSPCPASRPPSQFGRPSLLIYCRRSRGRRAQTPPLPGASKVQIIFICRRSRRCCSNCCWRPHASAESLTVYIYLRVLVWRARTFYKRLEGGWIGGLNEWFECVESLWWRAIRVWAISR